MLTQRIEEASKLMDGLQVRLCSACRPARCSLVLCSTAALLPVLVRPAGSPTHLNLRMRPCFTTLLSVPMQAKLKAAAEEVRAEGAAKRAAAAAVAAK